MNHLNLSDGIDFYIKVFNKISAIYSDNDDGDISIISSNIAKLIKELNRENDEKLVKKALIFIISIYENYLCDDYNTCTGLNLNKVSSQEKIIYKTILEKEFFPENFQLSQLLHIHTISEEQRDILLPILKKELSRKN